MKTMRFVRKIIVLNILETRMLCPQVYMFFPRRRTSVWIDRLGKPPKAEVSGHLYLESTNRYWVDERSRCGCGSVQGRMEENTTSVRQADRQEGTVVCGEVRPSRDIRGILPVGNVKHGEHPQTGRQGMPNPSIELLYGGLNQRSALEFSSDCVGSEVQRIRSKKLEGKMAPQGGRFVLARAS